MLDEAPGFPADRGLPVDEHPVSRVEEITPHFGGALRRQSAAIALAHIGGRQGRRGVVTGYGATPAASIASYNARQEANGRRL